MVLGVGGAVARLNSFKILLIEDCVCLFPVQRNAQSSVPHPHGSVLLGAPGAGGAGRGAGEGARCA